ATLGETTAAAPSGRKTAAATPAPASEPLITRLIVKYRDPSLEPSFAPGGALSTMSVDRLSTLSGQAIARERPMSGGAWVVRLSTPLSRGDAESLARTLESDPDIEYAEPDRWIQPTLVPHDESFAQQWDLMPGGISAGG